MRCSRLPPVVAAVAQLPGGTGQQRLGQHRVAARAPAGRRRGRCWGRAAPIRSPPSGRSVDLASSVSSPDVDEHVGRGHAELHEVDQVGAARRGRRRPGRPASSGDRGRGVGRRARSGTASSPHALGRGDRGDGGDDVGVGGAAAEVAAHPLADLVVGEVGVVGRRSAVTCARPARPRLLDARRPRSRPARACSSRTGRRRARRTPGAAGAAVAVGREPVRRWSPRRPRR